MRKLRRCKRRVHLSVSSPYSGHVDPSESLIPRTGKRRSLEGLRNGRPADRSSRVMLISFGSYVQDLEDRVERTERLIQRVRPDHSAYCSVPFS